MDRNLLKNVVHISVIPLQESSTLHLMAITQVTNEMGVVRWVQFAMGLVKEIVFEFVNISFFSQAGVRLYFTTTPQGRSLRPSLISLVHVRLPPGHCPSNAATRPGNTTHQAFYRKGCLLLACSQTEDRDSIWLVEPDSFPFQYNLMESFVTYPLNGKAYGWGV